MLFVTGGAYQGKLDYVKERFSLKDEDVFCCKEDAPLDLSKRCICHYERYILFAARRGEEPLTRFSDDKIVIMDDLNCGVVPIDPEIRAYRETVGRTGCAVARNADEVVRVFCGIPKALKTKTVKIRLIRHGMTRASEEFRYCGSTDLPLSERGRAELEFKKAALCYPKAAGERVYTSALCRAKQTAQILFPGAKIETDAAFNEMDFGDFELRKYSMDLESDPDFITWASGDNERNVCPHGESSAMMKRRVLAAFRRILAEGEDCTIVCHGGPIAAVFAHYNSDSGRSYYQTVPKYAEGYFMEFENGRQVRCMPFPEN